jgi:hypothetical protein
MNIRQQISAAYLDYFNNYLTLEKYAEHNGITVDQAKALVELGRTIHHELVTKEAHSTNKDARHE